MAKILDTNVITTKTYKMIELKKGFIINGQYYLKDNMQPVPFNTVTSSDLHFTADGGKLLSVDRVLNYLDYNQYSHSDDTMSKICFDSKDEDIVYVGINASPYRWLCKFKEKNNRCELLNAVKIVDAAYAGLFSVEEVGDNINVIISGAGNPSTGYKYSKDGLVAKGTFSLDGLGSNTSYRYDQYTEIDVDDIGYFTYKSGYGNVYTFSNKSNETRAICNMSAHDKCLGTTDNFRNRFNYHGAFSKTKESISIIHMCFDKTYSGDSKFNKAVEVTYDYLSNKFVIGKDIQITVDSEIEAKYPTGYYKVSECWFSDSWYKTIGGKKYTILLNRYAAHASSVCRALFFEHKIELNEDNEEVLTLHLCKVQEFQLGLSGSVIHYRDEEKLRFHGCQRTGGQRTYFTSVYCYELDESKLEFVKTFNVDGVIKEFGFDLDRNLYVLWTNDEVSRYNDRTVANFNARFENGLYEYQGEDIDTNLIVSTTNLQGDMLSKEVTLDIRGNATFKENGNKTLVITTSADAELKIPMTITGAGALSIFPKVKL